MVGDQLVTDLVREIDHYLGIPYFINTKKLPMDNVYVGKGNWKEIKSISTEYNALKKNGIGIDCSGLVCQLLNRIFKTTLDVRKTSASMLTSPPLSTRIAIHMATTGDLVRSKNGHHVAMIVNKVSDNHILCVESSRQGRGVHYSQKTLTDKLEIYRLTSLQPTPDT